MSLISMKSLLETGVHFGHRTQKWHPKMKPYIFTERNGIHIIDLQQTVGALEAAYNLIRDTVSKRGVVLFVGTKRQAQDTIQKEAERSGLPYVNQRWLGGTLTNWRTIKEQISELKRLEEGKLTGKFTLLTKKEQLMIDRRIVKLNDRLGGIRSMTKLPDLLFIVDVRREATAVEEANKLGIPVLALVDTNCDPSGVDYVIPSNDDAIRAIKLMTARLADAALEGAASRKDEPGEEGDRGEGEIYTFAEASGESNEELLGAATLAKLGEGGDAAAATADETADAPAASDAA
ncbi:MAG TPA: 30S ribosomal protein S2 [Anaerolineales bacterium]|nr:30S ribosomal protein S2 [Anaerolineales bacterium]